VNKDKLFLTTQPGNLLSDVAVHYSWKSCHVAGHSGIEIALTSAS
jgi:hypothetical protein